MQRASKLFWPVVVTPKNAVVKNADVTSRSQKLMLEMGLIKSANNGTFHLMPIAQRALDKCIDVVVDRMQAVAGQRVSLPVLTSAALWQKTGRLDGAIDEFFMVRDRHGKQFLLSPTHEESITAMIAAAAPISYRQLPLRLFQVGPKFRDELKPRCGLMRAKEFLMKDMYTFDRSLTEARATYEEVNAAYTTLFEQLEVPFVRVAADAGMMGGSVSHEFHYLSPAGEDRIMQCTACGHAANLELSDTATRCPQCQRPEEVTEVRGIEVGHAFLLGDKYSRPLGATFLQESGKPEPLVMGCYGIGVSRLLAASLEVLSTDSELHWPTLLAPYDVCVIGPKQGSKEQSRGEAIETELCHNLVELCGADDVLHDDRKYLTIGKRLMDAKRLGQPIVVVVGSKCLQDPPMLEVHADGVTMDVAPSEALSIVAAHRRRKSALRTGGGEEARRSPGIRLHL